MGLGGGFVMTIYSKEKGQVESLMAREVAPLAATEDMFKNGTVDSVEGGLAIAVPGELRGYWEVHQKYGVLPWADLIQPTIELCRQGHLVSPYLENILRGRATRIYSVPSLREIYINPETNTTWQQGDRIKRLQLAQTLEVIAAEGVDALYNGTLTKGFIEDIQNFGGIVTEEDLLEYRFPAITRKRVLIVAILAAIVVAAVVIALYFTVWKPKDEPTDGPHKMAIVANGMECADIGMSILKQKGSAADAALATLFCEGVTCPQSMGLVESLMAREVAPLAATEDMFKNGTVDSVEGGLAIAVPGELRGYWEVHQKYGVLPWADLIQPTIELCRQGHLVSPYLENILRGRATRIYAVPSLREIYINPETNTTWQQGDRIKRLQLAQTLEVIAAEGVNALYNGTLTKGFIEDIQNFGGIVTEEDLLEYRFGAMRRSQSTGIILNDEMDDFSIPGKDNVYGIPSSPANFVYPRKTPMSSMCPSILVDHEGNARMIVGGAGGSKITTSVSYLIMRHLLFNESLMDAMHAKRIHHQLAPMRVDFENGFSEEIIKGFSDRNHEVYEVSPGSGFAALTAISFDGANRIDAVFDPRRNGSSSISEM
uniref:Gamma-glutamyltransferase n=1 Tax=Lutzomyia longipalpis TaxID=7200 RepID=A0A1B0CWE2_LUTLO